MTLSLEREVFGETDLGWGEDYGPWKYRKLHDQQLTSVLTGVANPKTIAGVDCISFQPCLTDGFETQDRYLVADWELEDGIWKFLAIFDGHAGHDTVNHLVENLPSLLKSSVSSVIKSSSSPTAISDALQAAVKAFDDSLTHDLFSIFPGGVDSLSKLSDGEIRNIINDQNSGGINFAKVSRCMQGSTVLIALIDPSKENLWVASLGDCQTAFGIKTGDDWKISILSADHNAQTKSEVERTKLEHPGEDECVMHGRVLGGIAVTRAVGDHLFKLDSTWTTKVFMNAEPGFQFRSSKPDDLIPRIMTPPYISDIAEVQHVNLKDSESSERVLIMCSDGLVDLEDVRGLSELKLASAYWAMVASREGKDIHGSDSVYENRALRILRSGLGGEDSEKISQNLTVELMDKWMDDITILVTSL